MPTQTLYLHRNAPVKPAWGEPCNRCGVCCAAELCPAGRVLFKQSDGPCPALHWAGEGYACGLLTAPEHHLNGLPKWAHTLASRLFARWIAVGKGCDSTAKIDHPDFR